MRDLIERLREQQRIYTENAAIQAAEGRVDDATNSQAMAKSCGDALAILEAGGFL